MSSTVDRFLTGLLRTRPDIDFDDPTLDLAKLFDEIITTFSDEEVKALLAQVADEDHRAKFNRFYDTFPDDGPLGYSQYPKHIEHFGAGKLFRERLFMAANRVGKSVAGAFECSSHLTGLYRPWWPGRMFRRGIRLWAAGATNETTRDIVQKELLGEVSIAGFRKVVDGSGLIPRDKIDMDSITWKQGVPNLVDTVTIRHKSGGVSNLGLKSYQQGRKAFEGTAKEIIWLDEEVPEDVYGECIMRLATTRGILIMTFTPLQGLTEVVRHFLPKDLRPGG